MITGDFTCLLGTPQKQTEKQHRLVQFTDYEGKEIRVVTDLYNFVNQDV